MKVGMFNCFGTWGDVLPLIAIAIELKKSGYDSKIFYLCPFELDFSQYEREFGIVVESAAPKEFYEKKLTEVDNTEAFPEGTKLYYETLNKFSFLAMERVCKESDLVITSSVPSSSFGIHAYAEKYNIPYVTLSLQHTTIPSTTKKVKYIHEAKSIEDSWKDVENHFNAGLDGPVNEFRKSIGLPALKNVYMETTFSSSLALVSISEVFCADKVDGWSDNFKVCGYLYPPPTKEQRNIPLSFEEFLGKGDAPIFFSLGSLEFLYKYREKIMNFAVNAAIELGKRIIIHVLTPNVNIEQWCQYENVYVLRGNIDHQFVMPKCSVIIHHGGTGTSHAACLSGCPSIVLHDYGDMPDWAEEMRNIGVAREYIHIGDVSQEWLVKNLISIFSENEIFIKAKAIGKKMQMENAGFQVVSHLQSKFWFN